MVSKDEQESGEREGLVAERRDSHDSHCLSKGPRHSGVTLAHWSHMSPFVMNPGSLSDNGTEDRCTDPATLWYQPGIGERGMGSGQKPKGQQSRKPHQCPFFSTCPQPSPRAVEPTCLRRDSPGGAETSRSRQKQTSF